MIESRGVSCIGASYSAAPRSRVAIMALLLAGAATSLATQANATALDVNGTSQTVAGLSGGGNVINNAGPATLTIDVIAGPFAQTGSIGNGPGAALRIVKTGVGRQDFNGTGTYTGGTELAGGTLGFGTNTALGTGQVEFTNASAILRATSAGLSLANAILLTTDGTFAGAGLSPTFTGQISGGGKLTKTGTGTTTLSNAVNIYTGGTDLAQGRLVVGGNQSLGTGTLTTTGVGAVLGATTTATLANTVVLNQNLTVNTGTVRLNGVISGPNSSVLFVDDGATLILGNNLNSYTGTTQIDNNSVLGVAANNAISGGASSVVVGPNNGTLRAYANGLVIPNTFRVGGVFTVDPAGGNLTLGGAVNDLLGFSGSLLVDGGGRLTLAHAANGYSGGTTVQGFSALQVSSDAQLGSGGAGITLNDAVLEIAGLGYTSTSRVLTVAGPGGVVDVLNAANVFSLGLVQGIGGFQTDGPGTVVLGAGNTYVGPTYVFGGTLRVTANSSISAAALNLSGGTFAAGVGGLDFGNSVRLSGASAVDSGPGSLTLSGVVEDFDSIFDTGSLFKAGSGLLILGNANTYSDGTFVNAGEIRAGTGTSFGTGSVELNAGTTLSTSGGSLTIANDIILDPGAETINSGAGTLALIGDISGTGGFFKAGSGRLTLSGVNTYGLGTGVFAGELRVNSSTGTGNTEIGGGATLSGTGSLAGTTFIDSGATLAPGNSPGTMTFVNLNLASGSFLNFDLDTPGVVGGGVNDLIIVSNNLTLDGTLNVNPLAGFAAGTYRIANYAGMLTDHTLLLGALPGGFTGSINFATANQVNLIIVGGGGVGPYIFWDGPNAGTLGIQGGNGIWNLANNNWTNAAGNANSIWPGTQGFFTGTAGTVDLQSAVGFDDLEFQTDGYVINASGAGTLTPTLIGAVGVDAGVTARINANILGPNNLEKNGAGTLILGGTNTFNGLVVANGTVTAASDGAYGVGDIFLAAGTGLRASGNRTITNDLLMSGGATINSDGNIFDLQGTIAGTGPLTIYEPTSGIYGTTILHAGNTYTGGTVVRFARLQIDTDSALGAAGAGITIRDQGWLRTTASFATSRNLTLIGIADRIETAAGTTLTLNGVINGTQLRKTGAGELALTGDNSGFSGGINLADGTLSLLSDHAAGTGTITTTGSTINYGNGVTNAAPININSNTTNVQVLVGLATQIGTISETAGPRPLTKLGTGELVLTGNNSFTGTFSINAGAIGIGNDNALGLGQVAMAGGTTLRARGDGFVVGNAINLVGPASVDTNGFNDLTLTGDITGTALTKDGGGRLTVTGTNTYNGGTQLNAGTLRFAAGNNLGSGTVTAEGGTRLEAGIANNAVFTLANNITLNGAVELGLFGNMSSLDLTTGATTTNGTQLTLNGVIAGGIGGSLSIGAGFTIGHVTLNGINTYGGGTTIGVGSTVFVGSNSALGSGDVTMQGSSGLRNDTATAFTLDNRFTLQGTGFSKPSIGGASDLRLNGVISGLGGILKVGVDQLTLNGVNTYEGGTDLNLGSIRVSNDDSLGTGTLTTRGGTTLVAGIGAGATGLNGDAVIDLHNHVVLGTGTTTIDLIGTTASLFVGTGAYNSPGSDLTLSGQITGDGGIVTANFGTLTLTGNNDYSGGTTANNITVFVGNDNALGTGAVTLNGASLQNNSGMALAIGNDIAVNATAFFPVGTIGGSSNLELSGALSGAGGLAKVGSDTVNLTGNDTGYTGNATVESGTLLINGNFGAGAGQTLTVRSDSTLGGTGTINANVTVNSGGIWAPGNSPGTITVNGNLVYNNSAILNYELGQASVPGGLYNDLTIVNGDLTFGNNVTLNVTDSNAFGLGVYNLFTYTGTRTGLPVIGTLPGAFTGFIQAPVPGFVNLIITAPGVLTQYWDGGDLAGNGVIDGGNGTWNNQPLNSNWATGPTPPPALLNSTWQGGVAVFQGAQGNVNITENVSFQGLQFSTDGYVLSGVGGMTANGATFIATDPGVTATINATIGGTGSINKQNLGTLVLNGPNTYSGGTTITAGVVEVGNNTALGAVTGGVTIQNGATLRAGVTGLVIGNAITTNGVATVDSGTGVFTLSNTINGPGSITKINSGELILGGNNLFNGLNIDAGRVTVKTDTAAGIGTIAMAGGTTLGAGANNLMLINAITTAGVGTIDSGTGVFTLSGPITGAGSIVKVNSGLLNLGGNSNYNGLNITDGRVDLYTATAGGAGNITIGSGTILGAGVSGLVIINPIATPGAGRIDSGTGTFQIDGNITGLGSISQIGTGNLILGGNSNFIGLGINQGTVTLLTNTAGGSGTITINDGAILNAGVSGLLITNAVETTGGGRINSGNGASTFRIDGNIGGIGSISQIGTGDLQLYGNNFFNGLGINQGTVTLGTNTAGGLGTITINNGAILNAGVSGLVIANAVETTGGGRINSGNGASTFRINGNIGGVGSISQIGTGDLQLYGNNFYNGLGINQGTVTLGTNTAGGIGTITINGGAILNAGVSGLVIANAVETTGGGRINSGTGTFRINGNIGGVGSISQIGTGDLQLYGNNFYNGLGINQGTVTLGTNTAGGIGTITINDGAILNAGVSGLVIANHVETTGGGRINSGTGTFRINGTIGGPGSISQIGTGDLQLYGDNSFVAGLGINLGTVTLGTNTAAGLGTITINNGAILNAGVSGLVIANNVETTGGGRINSGTGTFRINGNIGGAGSISQIGTGDLQLYGNNSFVAGLGINLGTVTLGTNTAAGLGTITINDGAILNAGVSGLVIANNVETTGGGRINSGTGTFRINGNIGGLGSISQIGTGDLQLYGNNTFNGLGINQGTVTLGTNLGGGIGTITINNGAILNAGVPGLVIANNVETTGGGRINSGTGTFRINGNIGGAGSISQIGTGDLQLYGNNSFAAGLGINLGTVTLGTNTAAGLGTITINGGARLAGISGVAIANHIETTGAGLIEAISGTFEVDGTIGGAGSLTHVGAGNLLLTGVNTFAGGLSINSGRVTISNAGAVGPGAITINNGGIFASGGSNLVVANNIVTTGGGRVDSGLSTFTLNGMISGAGSISQIGGGNLILGGANSFAAGLGINLGTVTLGTNTAAGSGVITINGGTTLAAGVTGLTVANNIQTTGAGRIDSGAGTFTLTGMIGNVGGITKVGSGTLALTGTSNYLGGTTISAGRLLVNGALTASTVTVGTGTTLGGSGSVAGVIVQAGGTVAPGQSVGTLTVTGPITFAAGSTYLAEIAGATSDRINATGAATLNGAFLSVNGSDAAPVFGTTYTLLSAAGGRTGTFTPQLTGFSQAFTPTVGYTATDVTLRLNPASIVGLLGSGGAGSSNIVNFANALDTSVAAGFNPQNFFPIFLQSGSALAASLNQLTGEINSANSRTAIADTRYVREAALDRLGASLGAGNGRDATTTRETDDHSLTFWARGIGSWTNSDADGNGSKLSSDAKGVITGVDYSFGDWKVGALFNYIESDVDVRALGSGKVRSTGGGGYFGYRGDGGFAFGAGGAASSVKARENRSITVPGIAQSLRGKSDGTTYQGFAEISYDLAAAANTRIEPFVRGAYVAYDLDSFTESGGFAALNVAKAKYDTTVLTAGVRGSVLLGGSASLKGSAGYQRTWGDRSPVALVSLAGTAGQAAIRAVPVDKDAFAGELGVDFRIGSNITLGASYSGVIGKNTQDHGVKGTLSVGF